jgi:hypothetical protein
MKVVAMYLAKKDPVAVYILRMEEVRRQMQSGIYQRRV